ncbi:MAG: response regulator [Anaerolineae bacterium]|nr:response regulator [Anaerolineae bacterium]
MNSPSIMLVDDNATFLRIAAMFLKESGGVEKISSVNGGAEALSKAEELQPDIVVVDLAMPDVHGLDLIPQLREKNPNMGIVALTLHDTEEYRRAALAAGADAFIAKSGMHIDLLPALDAIGKNISAPEEDAPLPKILVLEDDKGLRTIFRRALVHAGYEVFEASNLSEARDWLTKEVFDLFISDINVGRERSTDLLMEYQEMLAERGTQVVMVSGNGQYQHFTEEMGAEFFMHKPVSLGTLITLINRLVGGGVQVMG